VREAFRLRGLSPRPNYILSKDKKRRKKIINSTATELLEKAVALRCATTAT